MSKVKVRSHLSPTLVLLALDWPDGSLRKDFLGFAIKRSPGFNGQLESWLPNRISFDGPDKSGKDFPSNESPIQKFMWWDSRIDDNDRGKTFTYTVIPVVGTVGFLQLLHANENQVAVKLPNPVENGIGTYFNRAVVSSQAFIKKFGVMPQGDQRNEALKWLGNGLQDVIPDFLKKSNKVEGAIYHLTDSNWVIPALGNFKINEASMVYDARKKPLEKGGKPVCPNDPAVKVLRGNVKFYPRDKTNIMHNKFIVRLDGKDPVAVLMGSANFTTGGFTSQANLLHTWESPELADQYLKRKVILKDNPTKTEVAEYASWSQPISVNGTEVRVFFPPERKGHRVSIDTILKAIQNAKSSVLFCLYAPTDEAMFNSIFSVANDGKMMFGLLNKIGANPEERKGKKPPTKVQVEIYHRSKNQRDIVGHDFFKRGSQPEGFSWEATSLAGKSKFPVYIHHKFIVIDGEADSPIIYTGSANMSKNAVENNDENILEITKNKKMAGIYLAEFMRLYEHYRARAAWVKHQSGKKSSYMLAPDSQWANKAYKNGTPECKSRINMAK